MPFTSEGVVPLMPLRRRNPHSVDTIDPFHLGLSPNPGPAEADEMHNVSLGPGPKLPTPPVLSESRDSLLPSVSSHGTLRDPRPTGSPRVSSRRFERPNYLHIFAHAVFCCAAYPVIYAGTIAAKDRSLFWARVIVGLWCAGVGVVIGWSLMGFATKYMEASTWATVIHLSHIHDGPGIKLKELAHNAHHPESVMSGLRLLWTRVSNRATDRRARKAVDSRPWSFFIIFYVFLICVAGALPFVLGRVVNISTRIEHQLGTYTEETIWGDLSENDTAAAVSQLNSFTDYVRTWTLTSFTDRSSLPTSVRIKYGDDNVYFAELTQSQVEAGGKGLGTFIQNGSITNGDETVAPATGGLSEGSMLKVPRWGIRMHCEKLPEPEKYLVPRSNDLYTYVIVAKALLERLFSSFSLPLPDAFETPIISLLSPNDSLPSTVNEADVAYIAGFWDNGVAHSFQTFKPITGEAGNGWVGTEIVLVRLNDSYANSATFPVYNEESIVDASGFNSRIGYDAVVCVEVYEPWVVEIYNSSLGVPTTMRIIGKSSSTDFESNDGSRGPHLGSYTRALNSTGKDAAFNVSHSNSINQMLKDNGLDRRYVPSPTTVSFTGNVGPEAYTELSPDAYADVRGKADASNVLSFLSGTQPLVVRAYRDEVRASASFKPPLLIGVLGGTLLLGVLAGLLVPALPFDIPRRGFGLFSWVAALQGQELGGEVAQNTVDRHMDLEELEETLGEKRVHFVI